MAGGAGGDEHVLRGQTVRGRFQVQQILLRGEHDAVLRFGVDLDLRMVGTEVTLAAGAGQSGDFDRGSVACVAIGAVADAAVGVRFADGVATDATALGGGNAFQSGQRMRRTFHGTGMKFLHLLDHLRGEILVADDRHP